MWVVSKDSRVDALDSGLRASGSITQMALHSSPMRPLFGGLAARGIEPIFGFPMK
tara:strand:+ start:4369 stop:4533 length:165 start_codon:yes stop_codon:yes gene_type:complete